jgi:hypothetical protein
LGEFVQSTLFAVTIMRMRSFCNLVFEEPLYRLKIFVRSDFKRHVLCACFTNMLDDSAMKLDVGSILSKALDSCQGGGREHKQICKHLLCAQKHEVLTVIFGICLTLASARCSFLYPSLVICQCDR